MFPKFQRIVLTQDLATIDRALAAQSVKLKPYRYDGPMGQKGHWLLEPFTVRAGLEQLRRVRDGGRGMAPGVYHRLLRFKDGKPAIVVMSDTDAELIDILNVMRDAKGRVLIGGLGMGLVVKALLMSPKVTHIDIIEIDQDIIDLVGPHYNKDPRVWIKQGDIFKWNPTRFEQYDWAWYDIWNSISDGNVPEMRKLKKRFSKYMSGKGEQLCWAEHECRLMDNDVDPRNWY